MCSNESGIDRRRMFKQRSLEDTAPAKARSEIRPVLPRKERGGFPRSTTQCTNYTTIVPTTAICRPALIRPGASCPEPGAWSGRADCRACRVVVMWPVKQDHPLLQRHRRRAAPRRITGVCNGSTAKRRATSCGRRSGAPTFFADRCRHEQEPVIFPERPDDERVAEPGRPLRSGRAEAG